MNGSSFPSAPLPKRKRLSYACNYCRAKKTRCDEQFPSCRNCQIAAVPCVTVNKRRPNALVQNRRKNFQSTAQPLAAKEPRVTALASPETSGVSSVSPLAPVSSTALARSRSPSFGHILRDRHERSDTSWDTRHLPVMPLQAGSSILHISAQWLDLAFSRLRIPYSSAIRLNLRPCLSSSSTPREYQIPCVEPGLPPQHELDRFVDVYFKVYHPVYPFLNRDTVLRISNKVVDEARDDENAIRSYGKVAQLMLLYLIIILGHMATPQASLPPVSTYLAYCHTILGHLLLQPSLESVQALLLFSITLRLQDQLCQAWDVLMLAISMSQTMRLADLGSHAQLTQNSASESNRSASCTWWALYVFEKFLAFDSGRPASLEDPRLASMIHTDTTKLPEYEKYPGADSYQHYMTSLANVLKELQQRSWHTWRKESFDTTTEAKARETKIRAAGEIDALLCKWRDSVPPEHQIGSSSTVDVQLNPQWAFLSFYYHQAIIVLYRNTLLLDWNELRKEVDQYGLGELWHPRIRNGPQLCLDTAKEMTNLQASVSEADGPSFLRLATSPLAAAYVLAIHIRRQPASILSRTHFELMKVATTITRQRYLPSATESPLNRHLDTVEQHIAQILADANCHSSVQVCSMSLESDSSMASFTGTTPSNSLEFPLESLESLESLGWMSWDWNDLFPLD